MGICLGGIWGFEVEVVEGGAFEGWRLWWKCVCGKWRGCLEGWEAVVEVRLWEVADRRGRYREAIGQEKKQVEGSGR